MSINAINAALRFCSLTLLLLFNVACSESEAPGVRHVAVVDDGSVGYKLYARYCKGCHAPPAPSLHTVGEWPSVIYRMQERRRMRAYPVLSDEELLQLIEYLQLHARKDEKNKR